MAITENCRSVLIYEMASLREGEVGAVVAVVNSLLRQTNSMIAATKHKTFEMILSAKGSGYDGKAKPKTAQTANTANIAASA